MLMNLLIVFLKFWHWTDSFENKTRSSGGFRTVRILAWHIIKIALRGHSKGYFRGNLECGTSRSLFSIYVKDHVL